MRWILAFVMLMLLALAMLLWVNVPVASHGPSIPVPVSGFVPVTLAPTDAVPTLLPAPPETRPPIAVPTPKLVVVTPRSIVGKASWYCNYDDRSFDLSVCHYRYPDKAGKPDLYAAACGKLRRAMGDGVDAEKFWRNKTVTVTGNDRVVKVKLVDWCGSEDKTIDLYRDAADVLGYTGTLRVEVSW